MVRHHHFDGCRVNSQVGGDNLVPDALSRREELFTPRLLVLVDKDLDEVKKNFLDDVREAMKHDEDAYINNRFYDERRSNKNPPEGREGGKTVCNSKQIHVDIPRFCRYIGFIL